MQRLRAAASRSDDLLEALIAEKAHLMECELCQMDALRLLGTILYKNEDAYWEQLDDPTIVREPKSYPEFNLDFLRSAAESVEIDAWKEGFANGVEIGETASASHTDLDHDSVQPVHDTVHMTSAALIARSYILINQMKKRLVEMPASLSPQEADKLNTLLKIIETIEKEFEQAGRDSEQLSRILSKMILPLQEEIEHFVQNTAHPPHD